MEEIIEILQKLSAEWEIFYLEKKEDEIEFEDGKLKNIDTTLRTGTSLRLIKDGKIGFAYTRELRNPQELVDNALDSLKGEIKADFHFPPAHKGEELNNYSSGIERLTNERIVDECQRVLKILAERTKGQVNVHAGKEKETLRVLNSNGVDLSSSFSYFYLLPELVYPGTRASLYRLMMGKDFQEYPEEYMNFLVDSFNSSQRELSPPGGKMEVLFLPETMYVLLSRLTSGTSGESIYHQRSPLQGKIGEKVFHEKLTIFDDPRDDRFPGARSFDDEGVPTQRLSLFEKGALKNFYCDLNYAAKLKMESTGSGFRLGEDKVAAKPEPSLLRPTFNPGEHTFQELLSFMDRGVIVGGALGAHAGNIPNGDFSIGLSPGIYVEKGEMRGRLKDAMAFGNIYQMMKEVIVLEDALTPASGGLSSVFGGFFPAILFDQVSVAIG